MAPTRLARFFVALGMLCLATASAAPDWKRIDTLLEAQVASHAFPGAVALVADGSRVLHATGAGRFTYGIPPPESHGTNPAMTLDAVFDLASLTKVINKHGLKN